MNEPAGPSEQEPMPQTLHVEVTTRCNLACVFCKQADVRVRARGELSLETFERVMAELGPSCRRVNLWGTGEPLLSSATLSMARHAADHGVPHIKISTNGTLLSTDMAERLLASGVTSVRIPLESDDAEEYRAWRGGVRDIVVDGIERLIARRNQLGLRVIIVVATVVTGQSAETLDGVRRLTESLGADGHELMPNIWADQWPVEGLPPAPSRCDQPLATLHVLADGDVIPCCHSLLGEVVLGNVHRQSVGEIWNGALACRTRAEFRANRFGRCGRCNFGVLLDQEGKPIT